MPLSIGSATLLNMEEFGVTGPFKRPKLNFIQGGATTIGVVDNPGANKVDVTISSVDTDTITVADGETESIATQPTGLSLSRVIPASTLTIDAESLEFDIWGDPGGAGTVTVTWDGGTIFSNSVTSAFALKGTIIRTGATAQVIFVKQLAAGAIRTVGTAILSNPNTINASLNTGNIFALIIRKWSA